MAWRGYTGAIGYRFLKVIETRYRLLNREKSNQECVSRTKNGLFLGVLAPSRILLENDPDCVKTICIFQKWVKYSEKVHYFMVIYHFMPLFTMLVGIFSSHSPIFEFSHSLDRL